MDSIEVERKYRCEHDEVRAALAAGDFTHDETITQTDQYFDHPIRSLSVTDEAVRIRSSTVHSTGEERHDLTYKGPPLGRTAKSRRELTTPIASPATMAALLHALDFESVATVEKRREYFTRGDVTVVLDQVTDLGEFAEIELMTDEEDITSTEHTIGSVASELGLPEERYVEETYLGLLLEHTSQ